MVAKLPLCEMEVESQTSQAFLGLLAAGLLLALVALGAGKEGQNMHSSLSLFL